MSITFRQSYQNAITDFQNLQTKTRDLNAKMNYNQSDKRRGSLQSLMKIPMWTYMEIERFLPYVNGNTTELMQKFNLDEHDSILFAKSIDIFIKAAFLTLFMFQVESLLKMIRNNLPNTSSNDSYGKIAEDVVRITHPTNWQQQLDVLRTPALIRNCLHNSGVHNKPSVSLIVNGRTFSFVQNQMFGNAGWDNLYFVIDELVNVLDEILTSQDVTQITNIPI